MMSKNALDEVRHAMREEIRRYIAYLNDSIVLKIVVVPKHAT